MRPSTSGPGTAARAAQATATLATQLSPGEKHGRKRMAEIVAVYDLDPAPRTAAGILTGRAVDAATTIRYQADQAGFHGRERTGADQAAPPP